MTIHSEPYPDKQEKENLEKMAVKENSHNLKPVTQGEIVSQEKQSFIRRLVANDLKSAGNRIVNDTLIPTVKNSISDIFHNIIDELIYGDKAPRRRGYTNYSSLSTKKVSLTGAPSYLLGQSSNKEKEVLRDDNEVIIQVSNRMAAEEVKDSVIECIDMYGYCKVADVYDLIGQTDPEFSDNYWGWKRGNLTFADMRTKPLGGKYYIYFPAPERLS